MKIISMGSAPDPIAQNQSAASPNYRNGQYVNLSPTPQLAPGSSWLKVLGAMVRKSAENTPAQPLKIAGAKLGPYHGARPRLTWFGHSSYLIQVRGKNILVDPVFSKRASFTSWIGPAAFAADYHFSLADLPPVDYLVLTHDHYDHLDYATVIALKNTVRRVFTPLGVGAHLRYWGFVPEKITELDWWQSAAFENMELVATPARHFSGRGLKRNQTLWTSYVLRSGDFNLFLGGDSGYDTHFTDIGRQYGPFDLAILENGQYNFNWPFIHMIPEETAQAAQDLQARVLLPVHWGRFSLAAHSWFEPAQRVMAKANALGLPLTLPRPGEALLVNEAYPLHEWWRA